MAGASLLTHLVLLLATVPAAVGLDNGLGLHGPALSARLVELVRLSTPSD
jgi:hypothetical protein